MPHPIGSLQQDGDPLFTGLLKQERKATHGLRRRTIVISGLVAILWLEGVDNLIDQVRSHAGMLGKEIRIQRGSLVVNP
ncbi:hypothetical protein OERS_22450 [Oerskovia enterophila]|uniref:Uncharacterized protein n=1 Tax=Oerskovia enterophila TaxID=43678 RepID=A0ABX2YAP7_9CELL|nr:hypothetical protein OERS_22450 [Oerskovia enterophila]